MKVRNVHERSFHATDRVGRLIDSLASPADALWPIQSWLPAAAAWTGSARGLGALEVAPRMQP
jgi:hypothetical protein